MCILVNSTIITFPKYIYMLYIFTYMIMNAHVHAIKVYTIFDHCV